MCTVCGCGEGAVKVNGDPLAPKAHSHSHDHHHGHSHGQGHGHTHEPSCNHAPMAQENGLHFGEGPAGTAVADYSQKRLIEIETDILAKNDRHAEQNRAKFAALDVFAINLVSSPGSGKTTLLCKTIEALEDVRLAVIEGDQQTQNDAERIRATGAAAVQVNTGKGCHLDGHMVGHAIEHLSLATTSLLFIENVGNLVCPASFDLGEDCKVAILSVTEGEDKPLKYPDMFTAARVAILNKIDLAPYCDADLTAYEANLRRINPTIEILRVSSRTGEGMAEWTRWLKDNLALKARPPVAD